MREGEIVREKELGVGRCGRVGSRGGNGVIGEWLLDIRWGLRLGGVFWVKTGVKV